MDTSAMVIFSWTRASKPQRYSMDNRFADTALMAKMGRTRKFHTWMKSCMTVKSDSLFSFGCRRSKLKQTKGNVCYPFSLGLHERGGAHTREKCFIGKVRVDIQDRRCKSSAHLALSLAGLVQACSEKVHIKRSPCTRSDLDWCMSSVIPLHTRSGEVHVECTPCT